MRIVNFDTLATAPEFYGFDAMEVDDHLVIDRHQMEIRNDNMIKLRGKISTHARYHGKRFITRQHNGNLHIKRVE